MVITLEENDQHIVDLEELFDTITKYNLKLNPKKMCVSGGSGEVPWLFAH